MAAGVYFDGRSARRREVMVELAGNRLEIQAGDERLADWPLDGLVGIEEAGRPSVLRVSSPNAPEARLLLDSPVLIRRLEARVPALRRRSATDAVNWLRVAVICAIVAALAGATVFGLPAASRPIAKLIPAAWEKRLGEGVTGAIVGDSQSCRSPAGVAVLDRLVARLTQAAGTTEPVAVSVVALPIENAFAAPGGLVVVSGELIAGMESPDELAGVLAHELAHVSERHSTAAAIRVLGQSLMLDLLVGGTGIADSVAQGAGLLLALSHSRIDERDADRIAVATLGRAGIRQDGLRTFFMRLEKKYGTLEKGALGDALSWISSHPTFAERIMAAPTADTAVLTPALADADWLALKAICD